ncbi:MAG: hypothetical protein IJH64_00620 [Oscillospiraceae bacterium]|nr:hypothetical protein [Oscillospiraceae bacterium]
MALTDENSMVMPVQPMYGGGYGGNGGFGMGGDWAWILLLLLIGGGGFGWGGGFGGMMGAGMMGMGFEFPWLLAGQANTDSNVNSGFRDAQIHDSITSVRDGISALATQLCQCCSDMRYDMANGLNGVNSNISNGFAATNLGIANSTAAIQNSLCNGFNGVNNSVFAAQTAIGQQLNANELASLNRSFAEQTANTQGFTNLNAGVADLRYTVATEACADRAAVGDALQNVTMQNMGNTNQIVNAINAGIQSIKDDLCADRLDAERRENQNLRTQLSMAQLSASQVEQTAQIRASQLAANNSLLTELRSCPIPAQAVYGNQPVFTCPQNQYGPCNCNGGNF